MTPIDNNLRNPFKNTQGNIYTKALFYETTLEDKSKVLYTLKEEDYKGYPSIKRLYLEEEDLTEYSFSYKYFNGYDHWLLLTETSWFKPLVSLWREELRAKLEHRYLEKMKERALQDNKEGSSANRMLLERLRKPKEAVKRGRPVGEEPKTVKPSVRPSNSQIEGDWLKLQKLMENGEKYELDAEESPKDQNESTTRGSI